MFETSQVRAHTAPAVGRITLLTLSLFAHSAIVIGALVLSIATIDFPAAAPDEYRAAPSFLPVQIPPPLGTPDGEAGTRSREAAHAEPVARELTPNEITAPIHVPDVIPETGERGRGDGDGTSDATGPKGPLGVAWGVEGSIGNLDALPAIGEQSVDRIYQAHEVNPPVLVHRVDPPYPAVMARNRVPATVVVRCVIDRNGRVREPVIVEGALPPFNEAVLSAVQRWRFQPGSLNGRAVDTYLELTVKFAMR
jgi:TonB family protein